VSARERIIKSRISGFQSGDEEFGKVDLIVAKLEQEAQLLEKEARKMEQRCFEFRTQGLGEEIRDLERARLDLYEIMRRYHEQRDKECRLDETREIKAEMTDGQAAV